MIDTLIIKHPKHGIVRWHFESSVDDEPADFLKAKALAQDLGIYEGEEREDMLTEFFEFENAMRVDGLIPQEDELTEALARYIAAEEEATQANAVYAQAQQRQGDAHRTARAAAKELEPLLRGKSKAMGGFVYTSLRDGYGNPVINKLEQA